MCRAILWLGVVITLFAASLVSGSTTTVLAACPVVHRFGNVTGAFDDDVDAEDALWMLRDVVGLAMPSAYCGPVDVDCNERFDAVDALKVLRYTAGLPYAQHEPCPNIGDQVSDLEAQALAVHPHSTD